MMASTIGWTDLNVVSPVCPHCTEIDLFTTPLRHVTHGVTTDALPE
jgi:hypothetical protein